MIKLIFDANSPQKQYTELFTRREGSIFKVITADYETVMQRIEDYKPKEGDFEVFPITPGTDTYSLVGPEHCIITKNTLNVTN